RPSARGGAGGTAWLLWSKRCGMKRTTRTAILTCRPLRGRRWSTSSASELLRTTYADKHGYQSPYSRWGSVPAGAVLGRGPFAARLCDQRGCGAWLVAAPLSGSGQSPVTELARRSSGADSGRCLSDGGVALGWAAGARGSAAAVESTCLLIDRTRP